MGNTYESLVTSAWSGPCGETFSRRWCPNGQQIHELLNITMRECQAEPQGGITSYLLSNCQKDKKNKCWWGRGKKGTLLHCGWECQLVQPLQKIVQIPQKFKIETSYGPVTVLLGIYPKGMKPLSRRDNWPHGHCSIIYKSQDIKQPKFLSTE